MTWAVEVASKELTNPRLKRQCEKEGHLYPDLLLQLFRLHTTASCLPRNLNHWGWCDTVVDRLMSVAVTDLLYEQ